MFKAIFFLFYLKCVNSYTCDPITIGLSDSVYCRCNGTYCDTFNADLPPSGYYQTVTSDKSGARFQSEEHKINSSSTTRRGTLIRLHELQQTIRGFGGALTDATLINIFNLTAAARMNAIKSWFGSDGSKYSAVRIPIGGTDFSTYPYSLDDTDEDFELKHFSLSEIDKTMRLPVMGIIKDISPITVDYLASAWSAPVWLKTTNLFNGFGRLAGAVGDKYHKTWAAYHAKACLAFYIIYFKSLSQIYLNGGRARG